MPAVELAAGNHPLSGGGSVRRAAGRLRPRLPDGRRPVGRPRRAAGRRAGCARSCRRGRSAPSPSRCGPARTSRRAGSPRSSPPSSTRSSSRTSCSSATTRGGAICQLVAVGHPERLGALVLTNCDAFENCPPSFFKALVAAAKLPGGLRAALTPMRTAAARRSPLGYGLLSHGDVDHLARGWVEPAFAQPGGDGRAAAAAPSRSTRSSRSTPPRGCRASRRPVLLAWAPDDPLFPVEARAPAGRAPPGRARGDDRGLAGFSMIDQPARLAELIGEFAAQRSAAGQAIR